MNYYASLAPLEDKLATILNDEGMVFTLKTDKYPIVLTVSPNASPAAQMDLFSADGGASSMDALMQFIFRLDGLEIRTNNRFVISDSLMSKIKGQAKKIHHAFLECFFAEQIGYKAATGCRKDEPAEPAYSAPTADDADAFADFFGDDEITDVDE